MEPREKELEKTGKEVVLGNSGQEIGSRGRIHKRAAGRRLFPGKKVHLLLWPSLWPGPQDPRTPGPGSAAL